MKAKKKRLRVGTWAIGEVHDFGYEGFYFTCESGNPKVFFDCNRRVRIEVIRDKSRPPKAKGSGKKGAKRK